MNAKSMSVWISAPSGDGKTPFPTGDISALKPITFGAKICPPGGGKE
jgi:hypothetical protein